MDARQLAAISRRPIRRWNQDGIPDICSGVFFLVLGGQMWAFQAGRVLLAFALLAAAYLFFFLFGRKAVVRAKERWVFPRTGRVVLRRPKVAWAWGRALAVWLALMALWMVISLSQIEVERWMAVVAGLTFGACLLGMGAFLRLRRHFVSGTLTLALTGVLAASGWRDQRDMVVLMLGVGAILLLSGAVALAGFLHTAPPAPQE